MSGVIPSRHCGGPVLCLLAARSSPRPDWAQSGGRPADQRSGRHPARTQSSATCPHHQDSCGRVRGCGVASPLKKTKTLTEPLPGPPCCVCPESDTQAQTIFTSSWSTASRPGPSPSMMALAQVLHTVPCLRMPPSSLLDHDPLRCAECRQAHHAPHTRAGDAGHPGGGGRAQRL